MLASTYLVSCVGQGEVHTRRYSVDQLVHTCTPALYTFDCEHIIHKMAGLLFKLADKANIASPPALN